MVTSDQSRALDQHVMQWLKVEPAPPSVSDEPLNFGDRREVRCRRFLAAQSGH
jgi:hypothetical protein